MLAHGRGLSLVEVLIGLALVSAGVIMAGVCELQLLKGMRGMLSADAALRSSRVPSPECTTVSTWLGEVTQCGEELRIN